MHNYFIKMIMGYRSIFFSRYQTAEGTKRGLKIKCALQFGFINLFNNIYYIKIYIREQINRNITKRELITNKINFQISPRQENSMLKGKR